MRGFDKKSPLFPWDPSRALSDGEGVSPSPPPVAMSTTVHCPGTTREKPGLGYPAIHSSRCFCLCNLEQYCIEVRCSEVQVVTCTLHQSRSCARLTWGYRHALPPAPGAGEEAGGRVGWGSQLSSYGAETGEGARPPPRQPHPNGDVHHGPLHGNNSGETGFGLSCNSFQPLFLPM